MPDLTATTIRARIKRAIVYASMFGLIPVALDDWLLRLGRLAHD
jgi:hypothetical protein